MPQLDTSGYIIPEPEETGQTNNFCSVSEHLIVQFNNSINYLNGNKFCVVDIVINNEVYDFPDIGTAGTNLPGPERRPASSQAPIILLKNNKPILTIGGAGGWKIYQNVLFKITCIINGYSISEMETIPPVYGSFGFLIPTNGIPQAVIDLLKSNNSNEFFRGVLVTSPAISCSIAIKDNEYEATVPFGSRTRGLFSAKESN